MKKSELEHIQDRIIAQKEYPGNVCPTEENLVRFITGSLSRAEDRRIEHHLSQCRGCSEAASKLKSAHNWFQANKSLVFAGFVEKASQASLQPWAACPPQQYLEKYAVGAIPDTEAGKVFCKRIETHLDQCRTCRELIAASRLGSGEKFVMKLEDFYDRITETVAKTIREFLLGIQTMAVAQGVGYSVRAMPGYRSRASSSLHALLLDKGGKVIVNDEGKPVEVEFDLIRAHIERDGHLVIDLATIDRNFWESPTQKFTVNASLKYGNRKIILPSEKIYSDGRVTIVGNLISGVEITNLPLSTIELTVTSATKPAENG